MTVTEVISADQAGAAAAEAWEGLQAAHRCFELARETRSTELYHTALRIFVLRSQRQAEALALLLKALTE